MEVILASSLDSGWGWVQLIIGLAIAGGVIYIIRRYKDKGIISAFIKDKTGDKD